MESFFQRMIEKISILNEDKISKHSFLEEICGFFDISHAFIYESDHLGVFHRKEYFASVDSGLFKESYNIRELIGRELLSELCSEKVLLCSSIKGDDGNDKDEKSELLKKLTEIFSVNMLVLIPILNQHLELAGFIGLGDRRKSPRHAGAELNRVCALLTLLANGVKLEMFKKGIANAEAAMSNVLNHIGIDIYVNDYYTHDILYTNKSMAEPYGGVENMIGKKCWGTIFTDKTGPCDFCPQPKLIDESGMPNKTYSWDYERPFDKSWFRVLSSAFSWTDGRLAHLVASVDITENKRNEMLIEKLALYDHLTGLANRRSLQDDIRLFIEDSSKFGDEWYLLFCDLDGFKKVNDTYGHQAGDVLLKGIADELNKLCNSEIRTYRQGGDEFVVLMRDKGSEQVVRVIIDRLFDIFKKQYDYEGNVIGCGCSIGVARYPADASTAKEIFHLADTAMYAVKKNGRGTVRFCYNNDFVDIDEFFKKQP